MSLLADIPSDDIRAFSYSLDALAGFGEELHIEARKSQLILWSLSMSMTAQAIIRISPRFFQQYRLKRPLDEGGHQKQPSLRCRVYMKTLRTIFRKNQSSPRPLDRCELSMVDDHTDSRLHLKFFCQNGVTKTHSLWYADTDPVKPLYSRDTRHTFSVDPALISDCLQYFHPRVFDMALECTATTVKIMSYWSETSTSLYSEERPMHTEFSLSSADFQSYQIEGRVRIAFNLKEFKTTLQFAQDTGTALSAAFDEPGKPIVLSVQQAQTVIAEFAIMTHMDDAMVSQASGRSMTPSFVSEHGQPPTTPMAVDVRSNSSSVYATPHRSALPQAHSSRTVAPHHPSASTRQSSEEDQGLFFNEVPLRGKTKVSSSTSTTPRRAEQRSPALDMMSPDFQSSSTNHGSAPGPSSGKNELFAFGSPQVAGQHDNDHDDDDDDSTTDDGIVQDEPIPKRTRTRFFQP